MKLKRLIVLFLPVFLTGISFTDLFSQNVQTKPTRQSSLEAFSKGDFEHAYTEFSELLITYSKDPLYKYYSGVCLVKLNREAARAVSLLQQALQGVAAVKTLPSDALFYLGRAQQMSGNFPEAIGYFNSYTDQVGKRTAREQGVPELIQQCSEKKGAIAEINTKPAEVIKNRNEGNALADNVPVPPKTVSQPVKKEIPEKKALPSDYEKILDEALDFQYKADSLITLVNGQKEKLDNLSSDEIPLYKSKISENELLAAGFQRAADQKYSEAQAAMNPLKEKSDSVQPPEISVIKSTEKQSDTIKKSIPAVSKPFGTFSFFEVLRGPVTDPNEKIMIDPEVPEGLIYRIQVAVFRNPVAPAYFNGITPVYGFKVTGTDRTNYYAGMFRRSADAQKALSTIRAKGFKDAFVVALSGNKPVSTERAAILEKEWGKKPFTSQIKTLPESPVDTIPPTLLFRVEVVRSPKPLIEDVVDKFKVLAGSRGLDIQRIDDGNIVYLIGNFITFESAAAYADLLVRNGYREAKVVAWLGNKEIPVETARQLFDNL